MSARAATPWAGTWLSGRMMTVTMMAARRALMPRW